MHIHWETTHIAPFASSRHRLELMPSWLPPWELLEATRTDRVDPSLGVQLLARHELQFSGQESMAKQHDLSCQTHARTYRDQSTDPKLRDLPGLVQ